MTGDWRELKYLLYLYLSSEEYIGSFSSDNNAYYSTPYRIPTDRSAKAEDTSEEFPATDMYD